MGVLSHEKEEGGVCTEKIPVYGRRCIATVANAISSVLNTNPAGKRPEQDSIKHQVLMR